ncbi:MAG: glycoside hydrolase family 99-like domain-containing protein [Nitrospirae bacterium]|nr:glycoside hydrolase family 99-like domain-containing protein [Nitrospirota bacterium]
MNRRARVIAFYLPQFHPIPENDEWWGKGFTEWTNVAKAKPLFSGHYQPHIPADFGFYDLRIPEVREAQAELAMENGVEAFCYYHYWFAGRRLLERPFNEILSSGKPNFPFCLCWANQTWTGIWHGAPGRILVEQTYPGLKDYEAHFYSLLKAFEDDRYVKINGKPLFIIYRPMELPQPMQFADFWRELAVKAGLKGMYLVGINHHDWFIPHKYGFDAGILQKLPSKRRHIPWRYMKLKMNAIRNGHNLDIYDYKHIWPYFLRKRNQDFEEYPCVIPNWDNSPRSGLNSMVIHGSTPELFKLMLRKAMGLVADRPVDRGIVFLKSWNEWAEGNHMEPDLRFGKRYLDVLRDEIIMKEQGSGASE